MTFGGGAAVAFDENESAFSRGSEARPSDRAWFTAAELAELALPGLPADKRSLNRRARDERWGTRVDAAGQSLTRTRMGRGGGLEFHVSLLPGSARIELARRGIAAAPAPEPVVNPSAAAWEWFDRQNAKTKAEAERRVAIVAEIELLEHSTTRTAAIAAAARAHDLATSTIWGWLSAIDGVARHDRLPALAPRRRGGGCEVEIDSDLWTIFLSDILRPSEPTFASCYDRTAGIAKVRGLSLPSDATMRRRFIREVPDAVRILRRKGKEALRRSIPSQRRDVSEFHALEWVNVDGHKFDVWVTPPGGGDPVRPIMVAIQDVRSSKMLAWRLDLSETAVLTRLAFADLFAEFGIPKHAVLDNGRAFASKWITGGVKTRFRFKIKPEEPTGLLTGLGIEIHFALPYRGQSKPIERAFRDMCDRISRHPAVEGAYTGNAPHRKPENYGSRAIGWDEFVAHVANGIRDHNAKLGRKGRDYRGRSFNDVFAESYATAQPGKASEAQLRRALLAAEQRRVDNRTGEIALFGNRYWAPWLSDRRGQMVTVRFDPDHLHESVHVYGADDGHLGAAELIADTGFGDVAGAQAAAKREADYRRRTKEAERALQLMDAAEVARLQPDAPIAPALPAPAAARMVRHRGTVAALKPMPAPAPSTHQTEVFAALRLVKAAE